jgi:hypothetical protein
MQSDVPPDGMVGPIGGLLRSIEAAYSVELSPENLPRGLDPWIGSLIERELAENRVLVGNGAMVQVTARCRLLVSLVKAAREWLDAEIDVAEAAETAGRCEETIRRAVRAGSLPDRRTNSRGRHRVRRGDLPMLTSGYDPAADAVRLAAKREAR